MATTVFNNIVLAVARRLKDSRATADSTSDTNKRYTSALLAEYVNRATREFLADSFQRYGPKAFVELFPEYVKTGDAIALSGGVGNRPSDCFHALDLRGESPYLKFRRLNQDMVQDIITGVDKVLVPSQAQPVFYEEGSYIKTLGLTSSADETLTNADITSITASTNTIVRASGAFVVGSLIVVGVYETSTAVWTTWYGRILTAGASATYSVLFGTDGNYAVGGTQAILVEVINALSSVAMSVYPRYIKTHEDISPSVATAGVVRVATSVASSYFDDSLRKLVAATVDPVFTSADIGKIVVIKDINGVYFCKIESIVSGSAVVFVAGSLPSITVPGEISEIYVSADTQNVTADMTINSYWHPEIIDRAVNHAIQDSRVFIS